MSLSELDGHRGGAGLQLSSAPTVIGTATLDQLCRQWVAAGVCHEEPVEIVFSGKIPGTCHSEELLAGESEMGRGQRETNSLGR